MPARKPPSDEKPQFERFIEIAHKVGAGETDEALERAVGKIAPAKRPPPSTRQDQGKHPVKTAVRLGQAAAAAFV